MRTKNSYYPNIMFIYLINLMIFLSDYEEYDYDVHLSKEKRGRNSKIFELNHKNVR